MLRKLTLNPVLVLYVVNSLIAMISAWGWHVTPDRVNATDTIVTGVLSLAAALMTRPVVRSGIVATVITVATAFGAFGLHVNPEILNTTVAFGSIVVGLLLHQAVTPAAAARQGTTADAIMLGRPNPGSQ